MCEGEEKRPNTCLRVLLREYHLNVKENDRVDAQCREFYVGKGVFNAPDSTSKRFKALKVEL